MGTGGVHTNLQSHTSPEDEGEQSFQEGPNRYNNRYPMCQKTEIVTSDIDLNADSTKAEATKEKLKSERNAKIDAWIKRVLTSIPGHESQEHQGYRSVQDGPNFEDNSNLMGQKTEAGSSDRDQKLDSTKAEERKEKLKSAMNEESDGDIKLIDKNQRLRRSEVDWWSVHLNVELAIRRDLIEENANLRGQLFWQKEMLEDEKEAVSLKHTVLLLS